MPSEVALKHFVLNGGKEFLSHISIDSVVFGFHDNQLKVLLLKMNSSEFWGLPGGFVRKEETVEQAAMRILKERTGIEEIFLHQFGVFSDPARSNPFLQRKMFTDKGVEIDEGNWALQRFISIGFFALVEFSQVIPKSDIFSDECFWVNLEDAKNLMMDHETILGKALDALRLQLSYQPVGYNLLPEKFTMPELQRLYETILGHPLDRRNFQRKMLSYNILIKLNERREGVAHKAPSLFKFDLERYSQALKEGL